MVCLSKRTTPKSSTMAEATRSAVAVTATMIAMAPRSSRVRAPTMSAGSLVANDGSALHGARKRWKAPERDLVAASGQPSDDALRTGDGRRNYGERGIADRQC